MATLTSSMATVHIIMMLELFAPHVSYVFGTNTKILTSAITFGLVLATMNTLIMLEFLPTVQLYSLQSYTYCPVCDFDQSLDEIYA